MKKAIFLLVLAGLFGSGCILPGPWYGEPVHSTHHPSGGQHQPGPAPGPGPGQYPPPAGPIPGGPGVIVIP